MNTTGGFDGGNGVHNVSLAKCAEGLNTCFLKTAPPQPQYSTVIEGSPAQLLVPVAPAPKIPDFAAAADTSHEQHQAESLLGDLLVGRSHLQEIQLGVRNGERELQSEGVCWHCCIRWYSGILHRGTLESHGAVGSSRVLQCSSVLWASLHVSGMLECVGGCILGSTGFHWGVLGG